MQSIIHEKPLFPMYGQGAKKTVLPLLGSSLQARLRYWKNCPTVINASPSIIRNAEMNVKKLLSHRYINNAAIAADLFPNQKYPKQTLSNKVNEVIAGTGRQRLTEKDYGRVLELFEKFLKEVR